MINRIKRVYLMAVLMISGMILAACNQSSYSEEQPNDDRETYISVEGKRIKVTTGELELVIVLNGSQAAAELVDMLPLQMQLIERNEFAKGMTLPASLIDVESRTREYEIGDFGYWPEGPDLAIFYDDIYEQTIVSVVPLGKVENGAEALSSAVGSIVLELLSEEN